MYICIYESFFERVRTCFHAFRKKQERSKKKMEKLVHSVLIYN